MDIVERLTGPQLRVLRDAEARSLSDGSGNGYAPVNRTELRIAERLRDMGLVTVGMATFGSTLGYVKITEAGRAARTAIGGRE